MRTAAAALFTGLFDDASMFPPADLKMGAAIRQHSRHRVSWYADTVGSFICNARFLEHLSAQSESLAYRPFSVAAVVSDGLEALGPLREKASAGLHLSLTALEVPLRDASVATARRALAPFLADRIACYVEVPVAAVDERVVHQLGDAGLRLKLRTGGTRIDAFCTEAQLASPILACAAERLQFKCTAGLHNAVRHRDPDTGFEHHGFLNVALAARVAATTGSAAAVTVALRDTDPLSVQQRVHELTGRDVAAIRAMFCSFGTCSVDEPIADLVAMGLVASA